MPCRGVCSSYAHRSARVFGPKSTSFPLSFRRTTKMAGIISCLTQAARTAGLRGLWTNKPSRWAANASGMMAPALSGETETNSSKSVRSGESATAASRFCGHGGGGHWIPRKAGGPGRFQTDCRGQHMVRGSTLRQGLEREEGQDCFLQRHPPGRRCGTDETCPGPVLALSRDPD